MKFILNTAEFKSAIEKVLKVPSAENVRLSVKRGFCNLCAVNPPYSVTTRITVPKSKTNIDIVLTETKTFAKSMKF